MFFIKRANTYVVIQKVCHSSYKGQQLRSPKHTKWYVVAAQLNDIRDDAASEFQNVFTKCQAMAAVADTTITVPRTVSRPRQC